MEKWLPTGPVLTAQDHGRKGIFLPGKFSKILGFRYSCCSPSCGGGLHVLTGPGGRGQSPRGPQVVKSVCLQDKSSRLVPRPRGGWGRARQFSGSLPKPRESIRTSWPSHFITSPCFLKTKSRYWAWWLKIRHLAVPNGEHISPALFLPTCLASSDFISGKPEEAANEKNFAVFILTCRAVNTHFPPVPPQQDSILGYRKSPPHPGLTQDLHFCWSLELCWGHRASTWPTCGGQEGFLKWLFLEQRNHLPQSCVPPFNLWKAKF